MLKGPSSFTKPTVKKSRKSPAPGDFDNSVNRDEVQSPAYSDISDDSTPQVIDGEGNVTTIMLFDYFYIRLEIFVNRKI